MDIQPPRTFPVAPPPPPMRAPSRPAPEVPAYLSAAPIDSVVTIGTVVPGTHLPAPVQRLIAWFAQRGLPPEATALLSVAVGAVAATALAMGHAGAGGLFALPAVALAWLALSALHLHPGRYAPGAPHGFVEVMQPVVAALLAGGLALDAAQRGSAFSQLVMLALLVVEMWAPAFAGTGPRRAALLGSHERLALLGFGCLFGQPLLMSVIVLGFGVLEVGLALLRLWPGGSPNGPRVLGVFGGSRGSVPAWARWTAFAAPLLLALLLSAEAAWRF